MTFGESRVVGWFSCGDASAVACKLALDLYGERAVIARVRLTSEHPDNDRFAKDCEEKLFRRPLVTLASEKYRDTWHVWEDRSYIAGIHGAPCTTELKKEVRRAFQRPDDVHILGYTFEEQDRAKSFRDNNPELTCEFPLIDKCLTKPDCHALIEKAGIKIPAMYKLGYDNNNCIGCPKGGIGYWNMIRRDFPETFNRMAELSRRLGARIVKLTIDGKRRPIFLDELPADVGKLKDEPVISCSAFCSALEWEEVA